MSLFSGIKKAFSGSDVDSSFWNYPEEISEIDEILKLSTEKPQLIYKHSNSCSICWFAKGEIESASEAIGKLADCHYINVVRMRDISNAAASKTGVIHQSPQVLILHEGEVVWNASHGQIRAYSILQALRKESSSEE